MCIRDSFITEAVLPYLTLKRLRIACVLGSATAGGLSMFFNCGICAPHGGVFIFPLATNPMHYALSLVGGTVVGAILFSVLSLKMTPYKEHHHLEEVAQDKVQASTDTKDVPEQELP